MTPPLIFTRTYAKLYWQVLGLASSEWRPAGYALGLSTGAQVGGRMLEGKLAAGAGVLVDVRALNTRTIDGALSDWPDTRPGEYEREVGTTRATALASFAWNINTRWSLNLGVQIPFTPRRDYDVSATLSAEVFF